MATNENLIPIPGRLHSVATEGHVAGADEIYDDVKGKPQSTINREVSESISSAEGAISAEETRAKAAEEANATAIATEKTRAEGAESTLTTNLSAEVTRATGAEQTLQTNITAEETRATAAEGALDGRLDDVEEKIPSTASSSNQLADKEFVNSSISTSTATFRGTSATGLTEAQFLEWANGLTKDDNDYVFWNTVDSAGTPQFKRYKYNGTAWVYEYTLNNSSFTAEQWASIQSGLTSNDKSKLNGIEAGAQKHIAPTATEVKSALGTGSGTSKYLREDGTWQTPEGASATFTQVTGKSYYKLNI